jgi:uncharacterized small protein (DUF1192 family)
VDNDDSIPRAASDPLTMLARQDLDPFSLDELNDRIAVLQKEIARTTLSINAAVRHRAGADALFKR